MRTRRRFPQTGDLYTGDGLELAVLDQSLRWKWGGGEGPHITPAMCKGVYMQNLEVSEQMRYLPETSCGWRWQVGSAEKRLLWPGEAVAGGLCLLVLRKDQSESFQHFISSSTHKSREFTPRRGLEPHAQRAGAPQQLPASRAVPTSECQAWGLRNSSVRRDRNAGPHCP